MHISTGSGSCRIPVIVIADILGTIVRGVAVCSIVEPVGRVGKGRPVHRRCGFAGIAGVPVVGVVVLVVVDVRVNILVPEVGTMSYLASASLGLIESESGTVTTSAVTDDQA